jgi:hypothetical protein
LCDGNGRFAGAAFEGSWDGCIALKQSLCVKQPSQPTIKSSDFCVPFSKKGTMKKIILLISLCWFNFTHTKRYRAIKLYQSTYAKEK